MPNMNVVVWEWIKNQTIWVPYSPQVTRFLESSVQSSRTAVNLGQVDQSLSCYDVDLNMKTQTRRETGLTRQIRRNLYPTNYPCGYGIAWQWDNDFNWISYDIDTTNLIEKQYQRDHSSMIDLEGTSLGIPNIIALKKMVQINKFTCTERPVRRKVDTSFQYPLDTGSTTYSALKNKPVSHLSASGTTLSTNNVFNTQTMNNATTLSMEERSQAQHKRKKLKVKSDNSKDPLHLYCKANFKQDGLNDECSICFEKLKDLSGFHDNSSTSNAQGGVDVRELKKCPHMFHGTCLLALIKTGSKEGWLQCPTCKVIQGVKQGIQPKDGTMIVSRQRQSLPGHPGRGMIVITYNFRTGRQGQEHPHPGKPYYATGFPRVCYLPDNTKGQKVLRLLEKAWQRRLVFTIATSNTTGQDDTVVWNEIHHKTEPFSNISGHGFPDPNYLDNVLTELSIQGVDDNDDA